MVKNIVVYMMIFIQEEMEIIEQYSIMTPRMAIRLEL